MSDRIIIPVNVILTPDEYDKFMKKYHEAFGRQNEFVRRIDVVRSERPKQYDVKRSDEAGTLFRWLFKL